MAEIAFPVCPCAVLFVTDTLAAFNCHIRLLELALRTLQIRDALPWRPTWAIWKDVLPQLLPMSNDLLRAGNWDSLAFGASLPVLLKHCVDTIKAWHHDLSLSMPPPVNRPCDYRHLTNCLSRFQATTQRIKFPIFQSSDGALAAVGTADTPTMCLRQDLGQHPPLHYLLGLPSPLGRLHLGATILCC